MPIYMLESARIKDGILAALMEQGLTEIEALRAALAVMLILVEEASGEGPAQ